MYKKLNRLVTLPPASQHLLQKFDAADIVTQKLQLLFHALRQARFPVMLVGAGISTFSLIPDYRSGQGTCVPTGVGRWNRQQGYIAPQQVSAIDAFPNKGHFRLAALSKQFKKVCSQNVDPLLLDAGISQKEIIHMHGQINQEYCLKCDKVYLRRFYVYPRTPGRVDSWPRSQGRLCSCKQLLCDSVIHFGQNLRPSIKKQLLDIRDKADLILSIGSSIFVNSAKSLVSQVLKRQGRLFQINLQSNEFTSQSVQIFGLISQIIGEALKMAGIQEAVNQVRYNVRIERQQDHHLISTNNHQGTPIDLFKQIDSQGQKAQHQGNGCFLLKKPFQNVKVMTHNGQALEFKRWHSKLAKTENQWHFS